MICLFFLIDNLIEGYSESKLKHKNGFSGNTGKVNYFNEVFLVCLFITFIIITFFALHAAL